MEIILDVVKCAKRIRTNVNNWIGLLDGYLYSLFGNTLNSV